jgi:hypothetical protein
LPALGELLGRYLHRVYDRENGRAHLCRNAQGGVQIIRFEQIQIGLL